LIYQYYLKQFENPLVFQVDGFTQLVANQVRKTLLFFNYDSSLILHDHQASVKLFLNQVYVSRVVEGCNALSVIILFTAFVIAFSGKWKPTVGFILVGSVLIHIMNVLRIALLSVALYYHPDQEALLHGVVFPLLIYGFVFGLWILWVNKFSNYASKNTK
jgi:exosortase family protein XrtF